MLNFIPVQQQVGALGELPSSLWRLARSQDFQGDGNGSVHLTNDFTVHITENLPSAQAGMPRNIPSSGEPELTAKLPGERARPAARALVRLGSRGALG